MRIEGYPFPPPGTMPPRPIAPPAEAAPAGDATALSPQEKLRRLLDEKRGQADLHADFGVSTLGQHIDLRV